ncbi:MAG: hypothetical protein Q9219_006445 [cf. Caloplaca sp. 3 TL-2023]
MHTNASTGATEVPPSTSNRTPQGQSASSLPEPPQQKKGKDKKIWSCHSCRRRKLKCDRSDPCGACLARGEGHSCTWEEGQRPEKNNRESLEQLPSLIQKLTQEVKELKTSNSELMQNIRYKEGTTTLGGIPAPLGATPDASPWVGMKVVWLTRSVDVPLDQLYASAPLAGFIEASQLLADVEEMERARKGTGNRDSPVLIENLEIKASQILACASLAVVNLDAMKADAMGIGRTNIDALTRDLWKKSRLLIANLDLDTSNTGFESNMFASSRSQPSPATSHASMQGTGSTSTSTHTLLLKIVGIKILLLLAARSFAAPSEYLKLHLDTIASAVEASLDSPVDDDAPLEEREWRWQLWSFLCVLDWTSPGLYHNGSYFIRPELHGNPPSKIPGVPDDGTYSPLMDTEHLERLSQTRYYLEYALALASLSRRADDCVIRPGPIAPGQAAELCSELDALDHKLSFYQLLGGGAGRGGENPGSNINLGGIAGARGRAHGGSSGSHTPHEHRVPPQRALQVQSVVLGLELGLVRFKLFRHEAFHTMHDTMTSGPLRIMCMDTCMDACILVLSHCRNIGVGVPRAVNLAPEGVRSMMADLASRANGEKRPFPGIFRRVIQPASSAALVAQVLLHASQFADGSGGMASEKRTNMSRPTSKADFDPSAGGMPTGEFYPYTERSMEAFVPQPFTNTGGAPWTTRFGQEKLHVLRWHVSTVITELESLQSTLPLARYKLALHRQCM